MTTLKNIIEALNALDDISDMTAKVGPWAVRVWEYRGEREIKFTREVVEEEQEGAHDDLPFA